MKLIGSRKLTWVICGTGVLLALAGVVFLPQMIPVHFANGIADDFENKIEIFFLDTFKKFLTDVQYNLMTDGVLGIALLAEIYVIYASFA